MRVYVISAVAIVLLIVAVVAISQTTGVRPVVDTKILAPGTSIEVGDVRVQESKGVVTVATLGAVETAVIVLKDEQIDVPLPCKYIVPRGDSVKIGKTSLWLRTTVQDDGGYLYEFFAPPEDAK